MKLKSSLGAKILEIHVVFFFFIIPVLYDLLEGPRVLNFMELGVSHSCSWPCSSRSWRQCLCEVLVPCSNPDQAGVGLACRLCGSLSVTPFLRRERACSPSSPRGGVFLGVGLWRPAEEDTAGRPGRSCRAKGLGSWDGFIQRTLKERAEHGSRLLGGVRNLGT